MYFNIILILILFVLILFYFLRYLKKTNHMTSIVSEVDKNRRIQTQNIVTVQHMHV